MSDLKDSRAKPSRKLRLSNIVAVIFVVGFILLVKGNLQMSWNIFLVVMGFTGVIFIHECGHFIVAKVSGIKVETFSVFLPPVFLGVRKTRDGFRIRILPKFFPKDNDPDGNGLLSFTIGPKGKAGDTEYRIGLIPLAGYVKMLGQDDTGADKISDDPRSFSNKPVGARMAVIAAGVIFNVIAAIVILMCVYSIGIKQMPAVAGEIIPDSPAARAGIQSGDEIIEIAGKTDNLDFGDILMTAALSDKGELVPLKIRKFDGSIEKVEIVAKQMPSMPVRIFGINTPMTLEIAGISLPDPNGPAARTDLLPGDKIVAVNGRQLDSYQQFAQMFDNLFVPSVSVTAQRSETELIETQLDLKLNFLDREPETQSDLGHIYSMVPRLRIEQVLRRPDITDANDYLENGDVIVAVADIENPTYKEIRQITTSYKDKQLPVTVLRRDSDGTERIHQVYVKPKSSPDSDRVTIGIYITFDVEHPVVARTIETNSNTEKLAIPPGATIISVDGVSVANFYDCMDVLRKNVGQRISIEYRFDDYDSGSVALNVGNFEDSVNVVSTLSQFIQFASLERIYKADGLSDAFKMSCKKSYWMIVKTYVTIKQLVSGNVSMKAMSGPVGIATMSYEAVKYSFVSFMFLMAFISANLAVINFLPIPVVDGGVFLLLIVEKIKGGPLSIRAQEIITYCGLLFLAVVFVYITYNDIARFFIR
ncbi:site-2 protease family protein [Planctomycetota bacterium]